MSWLPEQASTFAREIDLMFWVIVVITGIAFFVVEIGLVVFLIKYRARPGRKAAYISGSTMAEVIWTAVPAVTVVILGIWSAVIWGKIKSRDNLPSDAIDLGIAAKQFEWNVTYPGADGELGTADDFTVRNRLHIPVNQPVVVQLTSEDVLHSFFVPQFRIKQDAVPGMTIPVWFEATKTGEFEIGCAELCGLGHTTMRGRVTVHTADDYEAWMRSQTVGEAAR